MAARHNSSDPPPVEIKDFTAEEIERGIAKLKRRIEQVKALENVSFRDQLVRNAEHDIQNSVLEIFGPNSPEYRAHQYHDVWSGGHRIGAPDSENQSKFQGGVRATITMLEGLISRLEEKRTELGTNVPSRARAAFEGLDFHPRIAGAAIDTYRDEHYREAVLNGAIALVNFVKEKSRKHDLDGASLMRTVFSPKAPVLAFNDLKDQTDLDEQEGLMHLFEGAVLALRNPRAHGLADDSPKQALNSLVLLSMLAEKVEQSKRRP
jgi:uncharacterized protein (TIGR02391 family)